MAPACALSCGLAALGVALACRRRQKDPLREVRQQPQVQRLDILAAVGHLGVVACVPLDRFGPVVRRELDVRSCLSRALGESPEAGEEIGCDGHVLSLCGAVPPASREPAGLPTSPGDPSPA